MGLNRCLCICQLIHSYSCLGINASYAIHLLLDISRYPFSVYPLGVVSSRSPNVPERRRTCRCFFVDPCGDPL